MKILISKLSCFGAVFILIFILFSCSKEVEVPFFEPYSIRDTSDIFKKTYTFSYNGDAELMVVFPGDKGHEFRFSSLYLNSEIFKNKLKAEGEVISDYIFKYEDEKDIPRYDTLQVIQMSLRDGDDYYWTIIDSKYSGRSYVHRFKNNYEDVILRNDTLLTLSANSNAQLEVYNTGYPINTKSGNRTLRYVYQEADTFSVAMVGTNVGRKEYAGDGYQTERYYVVDEYGIERSVTEFKVVSGEVLDLIMLEEYSSSNVMAIDFSAEMMDKINMLSQGLSEEDFEIIDEEGKIVPIAKGGVKLGNSKWEPYLKYKITPQIPFESGKTYGIRAVRTFYGDFTYGIPFQ